MLLRERRNGAFVLDLCRSGRKMPGARRYAQVLSAAAIARQVPISTSVVALIGDDARAQTVARVLALRLAVKRVLMVPPRLIEAPDLAGVWQLTPRQFADQWRRAGSPIILDFSEPEEWQAAHLPHSRYISTARLLSRDRSFVPANREVYVSCAVGHRSQLAAQILGREGVRVWNLRGGVLAWEVDGLPLERTSANELNGVPSTQGHHEA